VALPPTLRRFAIALADADRGVYEQLDLRVAQHPSESERYLVARVIARALEHGDGVEFSPGGVSDASLPALVQRDLQGTLVAWIEVGSPAPDRLHKATKACRRVAVYAWKSAEPLAAAIAEQRVHRASDIELTALDEAWLERVAATLDRNNAWSVAVSGGTVYLECGGKTFETVLRRVAIG
jgi:uncharacterized protein YaeQ